MAHEPDKTPRRWRSRAPGTVPGTVPGTICAPPTCWTFSTCPPGAIGKPTLSALIDNLQDFLLELGKGFAFVERQQRIYTEDQDFYVDPVLPAGRHRIADAMLFRGM